MKDRETKEFWTLGEENLQAGGEFYPEGSESLRRGEELFPTGTEYAGDRYGAPEPGAKHSRNTKEKKTGDNSSKIRKMGYLVAASVSVVTVSTTAMGSMGLNSSAMSVPVSDQSTSQSDDFWYVGDPDNPKDWYIIGNNSNTTGSDDTVSIGTSVWDTGDGTEIVGNDDASENGVEPGANATFPKLTNLEPNLPVPEYGSLNEQYIVLQDSASAKYIYAGTAYTSYKEIESYKGARYDEATNTLYLSNCDCDLLAFNWMGNGFTINLTGTNNIGEIRGYGFHSGGSLTITGTGNLTVGTEDYVSEGITLYAEESTTCLMIDDSIEYLEVYGFSSGAISVIESNARYPVYYKSGLRMYGGESFVQTTDAFLGDVGVDYRSFAVGRYVNGEAVRSQHVVFKHAE